MAVDQQNSHRELDNEPQRPVTNFSIEEILKPDFGNRKRQDIIDKLDRSPVKSLSSVTIHQPASLWPAWVYCTRYSDRPSSGPRSRKFKKRDTHIDEKRPRTAFTAEQLQRLKKEFEENRYLTEIRRHKLANELKLNESQIKIWFQNKRAKLKKTHGTRNHLAIHLMAQGLYNHATMSHEEDEEED